MFTVHHNPAAIKSQLVLLLASAIVFFVNLGVPRLWDEDEPRNAACAREMLERGDWVVPTFNYELRTQKPVLLYWLMMASYSLFGVNEFAARLPSAVLATGTVLVTFHLGRLLLSVRAGLLAGLMMATCLMFGVAGRAATPDSCLIFFVSLSQLAFVRGVVRQAKSSSATSTTEAHRAVSWNELPPHFRHFLPSRWVDFALMYGSMGLAFLAKGPVGLALPVAIIGLFLLLVHREQCSAATQTDDLKVRATVWLAMRSFAHRFGATAWSMRPLTIVLVVTAIAAPWYVLVGLRTDGEWLRGFFGTENLARFQSAMEGHNGPIVYYPIAILIGFFPWSIVLPAAVWFSVRDVSRINLRASANGSVNPSYERRAPAHLLLLCWAGIWIGLFSLADTKLPSYVLPAYPALALMAAAFVDRWLTKPNLVPRWLMQTAWGSLVLAGVGLAIGLPLAARQYLPGEELIGLVGLIPLVGGLLAMIFLHCGRPLHALAAVGAMAIFLSASLFGGVAVRTSRHQNSPSIIEIARRQSGPDVPLATFAHPESSVIYYARGRVERYDEPAAIARFLTENKHGYIITNDDRWHDLQPLLPSDIAVIARQPRFLKDGEVLLLGRRIETAAVSGPPRS